VKFGKNHISLIIMNGNWRVGDYGGIAMNQNVYILNCRKNEWNLQEVNGRLQNHEKNNVVISLIAIVSLDRNSTG